MDLIVFHFEMKLHDEGGIDLHQYISRRISILDAIYPRMLFIDAHAPAATREGLNLTDTVLIDVPLHILKNRAADINTQLDGLQ